MIPLKVKDVFAFLLHLNTLFLNEGNLDILITFILDGGQCDTVQLFWVKEIKAERQKKTDLTTLSTRLVRWYINTIWGTNDSFDINLSETLKKSETLQTWQVYFFMAPTQKDNSNKRWRKLLKASEKSLHK